MGLSYRSGNALIFFGCVGLIVTALYFQYAQHMAPCPLCITQRIFVILVGIIALVAAVHNPRILGRWIYSAAAIVAALAGMGVSLRHVWIQNLPADQLPSCGPGLGYMFENFPLSQALSLLFQGDGNCANVSWTLLGLSMPAWVAICFLSLAAASVWLALRKN